jgi:two-component SAPR family response regulator
VRPRTESGLARTVTMLAYLADRQVSDLEGLIAGVFGEEPAANARRYVQNIRTALKRTLPALRVDYDVRSKLYSLRPVGVRFAWDVALLREALALGGETGLRRALALYAGAFLPREESDWAFKMRHDLRYGIAALGLEVVTDAHKRGDLEVCIALCERLLGINPVHVSIVLVLIEAIIESRGVARARQRLQEASDLFVHEFGDVPDDLRALERDPRLYGN